jgi:polysaccharide export outer membrane protein
MGLAFGQGCAKRLPPQEPNAGAMSPTRQAPTSGENETPLTPQEEPAPGRPAGVQGGRQVGARISTYYLSAGDEIRITVAGYPDLSRTVRIPPDGHISYPTLGDIAVDGMSIPELRQLLAEKLRSADEQRIATGDQILIKVYRNEDLTITTIVPSSGRVNVPLAGDVNLAGLTVEEARAAIAEKMKPFVVNPSVSATIQKSASGLPGPITNPQISVEVLAFGGHKILVMGEVQRPGVYLDEGGSRLLEIVAQAGGPTKDAKMKTVALIRPATETSPPRTALVDLERVMKNGELAQNPPVQRGDVIYVPRSTIANVALFFERVYAIVRPLVSIETGIWLGQNIDAGPRQGGQVPGSVIFQ